ncbi:MAG: protein kinase [Symploca sp. SIO2E6]|nr:protein kinase [Symploca sp. SIO2E6]
MSYCLNTNCQQPQNSNRLKFCQSCGSSLLLKGRYRAIKLIGKGGFGRTFLAVDEDKPSKPYCVIKQFFPSEHSIGNLQKALELFEQEAVRLEEVGRHPQLTELLAHFAQDNRQYLVQEFIDGSNLAQTLIREGAFDERKIWSLLKSLLPVLEFIHDRNIIHRDIKPENIILRRSCSITNKPLQPLLIPESFTQEQRIVLVDFGAAKFATITALQRTGTVIGSAGYTAPEQTVGKAVFASDLYSLGVTCIHLLTKRHPLDIYSVADAAWMWQDYLSNSVSNQLDQVLNKLLQHPLKKRYQSATEVLKDLNAGGIPTPSQYFVLPTAAQQQSGSQLLLGFNGQCIHTLRGHLSSVFSVAISPDGNCFASGSFDNKIKLWDLKTGQLLRTFTGHSEPVLTLTFSPNGQTLASGSVDDTIKLWDLATGSVNYTIADDLDAVVSLAIAISQDGQFLASGGDHQKLKIWQLSTGKLLNILSHSRGINTVAFSPDGQLLASGSSDNTVRLWQLSTGELLNTLVGHTRDVNAIAISPDSQILASGSSDNTIKLWNLGTGKLLKTLKGHLDWVRTVVFSPDGQLLVSGSTDATIKLWWVGKGTILTTLRGHQQDVNSIAISPDGQMLVSGSRDRTIKVWQLN